MVKRRRLRGVQHRQCCGQKLDLPGRHIGVHRALGPIAQAPLDRQNVFTAQPLGSRKYLLGRRIENHLEYAFPVAQVDEYDTAMIAAAVHPTGDRNLLTDQGPVHMTAVMTAH